MKIEDYISKLDSERFGFKIAKINSYNQDIETTLHFLQHNNIKLIISRINLNDLKTINTLEKNGFETKDVQATYKYFLKNLDLNSVQNLDGIKLRDAQIKDCETLELIALNSFKNYGHYASNKKLDQNKCNEIYGDWIKRSLNNNAVADKIIVAEENNIIAGFLSFKKYHNTNGNYAAGGIGAVSAEFRSKNIFKKISYAGLIWAKNENLDWVEHNVLINNYPINKSFSKQGFAISETYITLHKWIE